MGKTEGIKEEGPRLQKIEYYRKVKPPTLKQYLHRRAVREVMAAIKGQDGFALNPETGLRIPASALAAREKLSGLNAEMILAEHPEWKDDYEREYS